MSVRARALLSARDLLPHLSILSVLVYHTTCTDYGVPIEIKLWDASRTPLSHMVDITNEFGLKVLAEHNFLNDNNIAFSPYGLMGILVALYEGVDGESSYQIQRGMHLPWNRNVMRIGFRDIHRTLKTYFVPEEGFLAGLALNNENVTFNENYKKVLRFYGFDLDNDQLPTLSPENSTSTENSTTSAPEKNNGTTTEQSITGEERASTVSMKEETTLNPNAETINNIDTREPTTSTMSPSAAANAESSTDTTTVFPTTSTTTIDSTQDNQSLNGITIAITSTSATETRTLADSEVSSTITSPTEDTESPTTTAIPENLTIRSDIDSTSSGTTNSEPEASALTISSDTVTTMPFDETTQTATENSPSSAGDSSTSSTVSNESNIETLDRRKKSVVDFIFTDPPYVDDYLVYRSYDVGLELPTPNFDGTMFLANGLKSVQVTYMHYDTVLEHAFLPHLEAAALRLPLDSDRYYLLVILPGRAGAAELGRLLSRMARESDLADVYAALRPRRVRAVVPSFTVKGHVTLTTDLQKLGIRDVFEPRQRDFTPMTQQPGVYVRSIEQAVSVAIRKYRPDEHKTNRYVTNRQPVTFTATYPFLYFVMDSSIHVALMAGKMVDPLNTRVL